MPETSYRVSDLFPFFFSMCLLWLGDPHTCHSTGLQGRGQLSGISSLLLPRGFRGLNASPQPWQQALLPN